MSITIGSTVVDLAGADEVSRDEAVATVKRFWHDFPRAAELLDRVTLQPLSVPEATAQTLRADGDEYMNPVIPGEHYMIALNTSQYGQGKRHVLLGNLAESRENGWNFATSPESVLEHELGHVVDLFATQEEGGGSVGASARRLNYFDAVAISGYALAGPHEAFAEAFAGWWDPAHLTPPSANIRDAILYAARLAGFAGSFAGAS